MFPYIHRNHILLGLLGTGAQDIHLNFAEQLSSIKGLSSERRLHCTAYHLLSGGLAERRCMWINYHVKLLIQSGTDLGSTEGLSTACIPLHVICCLEDWQRDDVSGETTMSNF